MLCSYRPRVRIVIGFLFLLASLTLGGCLVMSSMANPIAGFNRENDGEEEYYIKNLKRVDPLPEWEEWYNTMELCLEETKGLDPGRAFFEDLEFFTFSEAWHLQVAWASGRFMWGLRALNKLSGQESIMLCGEDCARKRPTKHPLKGTVMHEFIHVLNSDLGHGWDGGFTYLECDPLKLAVEGVT